MSEDATKPACSMSKGFNYCFWAKFIVGVPAITIVDFFVMKQFSDSLAQMVAVFATTLVCVAVAVKIDRMKQFSGKVVKNKD